ncbi:MAG: 23S rRNA (uracil(1939)-C(5))-methyltransferase RlmD [Gammaproteobacteria bacterium]
MGRSRRKKLPLDPFPAHIESLAHDGRGVARIDGKTTFIRGALPGEDVEFIYTSKRRNRDEGRCVSVQTPSPERVEPGCPHFGLCGGCSLQHQDPTRQIEAKFQVLKDNLERIGKVEPEAYLAPLTGPHWGYRHKARLGARYVHKKEKLLVGFREAGTSKVADLTACAVLHPAVGERLTALREMLARLSVHERIPQIEVAVGDDHGALIVRNLEPLPENDRAVLRAFGRETDLDIYLQPGGPDTVEPLTEVRPLSYRLPEWNVEVFFRPDDFTQVNTELNRSMVARALEMLDPKPEDRVLDLFCGLGNFTLPLARKAGQVTGVEGDAGLVERARENARSNGVDNVNYFVANLMEDQSGAEWLQQSYDKILLDPPRSGAVEMIPHLAGLGARRIVYVSCHPGSLARDAGLLVNEHGYRMVRAGVMDMFPHTAHVESIALFERKDLCGAPK